MQKYGYTAKHKPVSFKMDNRTHTRHGLSNIMLIFTQQVQNRVISIYMCIKLVYVINTK